MTELQQAEAKRLIESIDRMAPLSPAALKIVALSNDPKTDPIDLVNAITMDPMLMAKVLRLVNSAYFGPKNAIISIGRAVILLGFNTIKNIALSVAVSSSINVKKSYKWFNNEQFWEHSLACALLAKQIAIKAGVPPKNLEEYFVSGLLHDIGKVALITNHTEICEEIFDPDYHPGEARQEIERERFGITHAELGGLIAEKWQFPPSLCLPIRHHHDPENEGGEFQNVATVVHLADKKVNELQIGITTCSYCGIVEDAELAALGVEGREFDAVCASLPEGVEDAKSFLQQ